MVEEAYVSFETAKLLKEKGFDIETEHKIWYVVKKYSTGVHWNSCTYEVGSTTREYSKNHCIAMPTIQMAMDWLETEYQFLFVINHSIESGNLKFSWRIYQLQPDKCHYVEELKGIGNYYVDGNNYNSRKECCESAIKYCLENLI